MKTFVPNHVFLKNVWPTLQWGWLLHSDRVLITFFWLGLETHFEPAS